MKEFNPDLYKMGIKNGNPVVREEAIVILHHAEIRDDDIDSILISILEKDSCEKVRLAAIRFISEAKDDKFRKILTKCVYDSSLLVRKRALQGLELLNS